VQQEISARFTALTNGVKVRGAALGELVTDLGAFALVMPPEWADDWRSRKPWLQLETVALTLD
jgi:hypothetical protein